MTSSTQSIALSSAGPELPVVDILTGRGFITGKSGSGKSNTASVIVEELLEQGLACLVIDTDGEYYGLKEVYEVLHVGADEECDLQVGVEHAEKLAELAISQNVPIILDVSGYIDEDEASALIRETSRHLFALEKKQKKPFLILVEEVHEYIPETAGLDETGQMLVRIAKRGRKRGLGLCGISQRPADVKKDFITQADWLVWHRLSWDNDTQVVRRVVSPDAADAVQELGDGEAILVADFIEQSPCSIEVRRKRTFDAGATPDLEGFERPDLKSVSTDIVEELREISEKKRQEQDTVERLREKIDELEGKNRRLREELDRAQDLSRLAEQFTEALTAQGNTPDNVQATIEEIREKKNEEIRTLRQERNELEEQLSDALERIDTLKRKADTAERLQHLQQHMDDAEEAVVRLAEALQVGLGSDEKLRDRIRRQREQIEELKARLRKDEDTQVSQKPELESFLSDEDVRAQIEEAKKEASSPRYVKGVIATLLQAEGGVSYEEIAQHLGLETTSHVGTAVNALSDRGIIRKEKNGRQSIVFLNLDGLHEIRKTARRRRQTERLIDQL